MIEGAGHAEDARDICGQPGVALDAVGEQHVLQAAGEWLPLLWGERRLADPVDVNAATAEHDRAGPWEAGGLLEHQDRLQGFFDSRVFVRARAYVRVDPY